MAKKNGQPEHDPAAETPTDPALPPVPEPAQDIDSKRPVYKSRLGRIVACVWQNHGQDRDYFTVTVSRLYKPEGSDVWCSASSFGRDDLPLVAKVCDAAHSWIFAAQQGGEVPF